VSKAMRSPLLSLILLAAALIVFLARPQGDAGHGLRASYYAKARFQGAPVLVRDVRSWELSLDGNLASSNQSNYSVSFEGFIQIVTQGSYGFLLDSDDGSSLWIDDRPVVANGGVHVRRRKEGSLQLASGEHAVRLQYSQGVGDSFLRVRWKPPGESSFREIPLDLLMPVPRASFDLTAARHSNLLRTLVGVLGLLLLLAAAILRLWARWASICDLVRDSKIRGAFFIRIIRSPVVLDAVCVLLCLGFYVQTIAVRLPHEPYMKGDSPYYANIVISILHDFDLDQRNQSDPSIFENPHSWTNIGMYDSNIARGSRGEWYPKHTLVLPFLSLPFYAAWGGFGLLIFNLLVLLALIVAMRRVAAMYASSGAACVAAVLVGITPLFHHFAYSYSADILAALLLVAAMGAVLTGRGLLAGLFFGLAVWTKLPNAIGLLAAGVMLIVIRDWKTCLRYCIGCTISLGAFAAFNWYQFGAPWVTSYSRVWVIEQGHSVIGDHLASFAYPFFDGLRLQLIDQVHGLVPTAGAAVLAVFGYGRLYKKSRPAFALILLFSLLTFLFYCKYDFITGSDYSNRFLMPLVAISAVPLSCLLDAVIHSSD